MPFQIRILDDDCEHSEHEAGEIAYQAHITPIFGQLKRPLKQLAADNYVHDAKLMELQWFPKEQTLMLAIQPTFKDGLCLEKYEFRKVVHLSMSITDSDPYRNAPNIMLTEVNTHPDLKNVFAGACSLILECDSGLSLSVIFKSVFHRRQAAKRIKKPLR
jgi:hypothetical protein